MPQFMLIYHAGMHPPDADAGEKVMAAWEEWVAEMGGALADAGSPLGKSHTVFPGGDTATDGGSNPACGYCILDAEDFEDALAKARSHPYLTLLGGSIEVARVIDAK